MHQPVMMFPPPPVECSTKFNTGIPTSHGYTMNVPISQGYNTCSAACQLYNQPPYSGGASSSGGSHMSYNSPVMKKRKKGSSKSSSGSQGSHNSSIRDQISGSETLQIHSDASGKNEKPIITDLIIQNPNINNLKNHQTCTLHTTNYQQNKAQYKLDCDIKHKTLNFNKTHSYQPSFYNPHHPNITILHEESESMRESEPPSDSDWYSQPDTGALSSQSSVIESCEGPSDTECPTDESGSLSDHPISHVDDMNWTKALQKAGEVRWKRRSSISSTDESSYPCETQRRVKKSTSCSIYTNMKAVKNNSEKVTSPVV